MGAVLRYLIGLIPLEMRSGFPVKTLIVNIIGCFAIGIITGFADKGDPNPRLVLLLKVGVCGGFTTFSSFALETRELFSNGNAAAGVIYSLSSLVAGTLAVLLGQIIVK